MARLPEFDRPQVLQSALDVFWQDGYESTTVQRLLDAMALNRGSFYCAFGDKEALFREVMDCYGAYQLEIMQSNLIGIEQPFEAIRRFLEDFSLHAEPQIKERGCLFFNAVSELSHTRPNLAKEAWRKVGYLHKQFVKRLKQARADGVIGEDIDLNVLADYLVTLAAGLRIQCKAKTDPKALQAMINIGMAGLTESTKAQVYL